MPLQLRYNKVGAQSIRNHLQGYRERSAECITIFEETEGTKARHHADNLYLRLAPARQDVLLLN
jgi:hypothetical protein